MNVQRGEVARGGEAKWLFKGENDGRGVGNEDCEEGYLKQRLKVINLPLRWNAVDSRVFMMHDE